MQKCTVSISNILNFLCHIIQYFNKAKCKNADNLRDLLLGWVKMKKFNFRYIVALFLVLVIGLPISAGNVSYDKANESFETGIRYYNNMQYLAAAEYFRKALAVYGEYHQAREYLARSYKLAGFSESALREWESLLPAALNTPAVQQKIDLLRYRFGGEMGGDVKPEFVPTLDINSASLSRFRFEKPVSMVVDNENNFFVTSFVTGKLVKFDPNGNGLAISHPKYNSRLYGLAYHNGRLAVSDFKNDQIYFMDNRLNVKQVFGSSGYGNGQFHGPEGVAFDSKGNLYVADSGNSRIQKFDNNGRFILTFGNKGDLNGEFESPCDLVWNDNRLYVSDPGNQRISVFDASGNFSANIQGNDFQQPRGLTVYDNYLVVTDEKKGFFFKKLDGGESFWFDNFGEDKSFLHPIDVTTDRSGMLYCLDYAREEAYGFTQLRNKMSSLEVEIVKTDTHQYPLVAFYINVKNNRGEAIYGLTRDNLKMTEDKARIQNLTINYLKDKKPTVTMELCVDHSAEMQKYRSDMIWASELLVNNMRKDDKLKVTAFSDDNWTLNEFDWSARRATDSLKKSEFGGGKYLAKTIYNAISDVTPAVSRRGVIIITDGNVKSNDFSKYSVGNIIDFARAHYVPVYFIVLKNKDATLAKIAESTGGAIYKINEADNIKNIYNRVLGQDENRYVVLYNSLRKSPQGGWWSDVNIELNLKGQHGGEWGGYYVPERTK